MDENANGDSADVPGPQHNDSEEHAAPSEPASTSATRATVGTGRKGKSNIPKDGVKASTMYKESTISEQ